MYAVPLLLRERVEQSPDTEALVGGGKRYTFKGYHERVNRLAHSMLDMPIRKGERVGILCKNNHPFPVIMMAAIHIGAVPVPLNWRLSSYELKKIIDTGEIRVLFYDEEYADALSLFAKDNKSLTLIPTGIGMETTSVFENLLANQPVSDPDVDIHRDDPALLLFTSGTTGKPKGCVISHNSLHNVFTSLSRHRHPEPGSRFLAVHPLFHMSSTFGILNHIREGVTAVFLSDPDPKEIWNMIEKEKINSMFAFPSVYTYMLEEWKLHKKKADCLQWVQTGGTKVPESLVLEYLHLGIPMTHGYGSTESFGISIWHPEMGVEKAGSAGKPLPNVEVKIINPDTGEECPLGEVGEIVVKSPYLFEGYWKNPVATRQVMKKGWFHMGDAGMLDEDGFLHVLDRYKDVIIYNGDNIYSSEVEVVIQELDQVMEVAVVGIPHHLWGEVPKAFTVRNPGSDLTKETIQQHCREKIASYKVPEIVFVDHLPKNALGKVLKHRLKEQYLEV